MIYQWTPRNREHAGKHGVPPAKAEYVAEYARPPFPRETEDGKQLVWGQAENGHYLQVIFVYLMDEEVEFDWLSPLERMRFESGEPVAMIIHAREMKESEKKQYRRIIR